jgi:hypothetical protein
MKTSNYWISGREQNAVSIAAKAPDWYIGRQFKELAPKYYFFKRYKLDGDKEYYTKQYYKEILDKLDPKEIYEKLGENAILLCYEKPGQFCHRRLVAEWLEKALGITIKEIGK